MPNAPRTPMRNFRVHDEVWHAAKARAAAEGTTVTAVIVAALEAYSGTQTPEQPRAAWGTRSGRAAPEEETA